MIILKELKFDQNRSGIKLPARGIKRICMNCEDSRCTTPFSSRTSCVGSALHVWNSTAKINSGRTHGAAAAGCSGAAATQETQAPGPNSHVKAIEQYQTNSNMRTSSTRCIDCTNDRKHHALLDFCLGRVPGSGAISFSSRQRTFNNRQLLLLSRGGTVVIDAFTLPLT